MVPRGLVAVDGTIFARTHFGGAVRYVAGLCTGLSAAGWDVVLVLPTAPREPADHLPPGIPTSQHIPEGTGVWVSDNLEHDAWLQFSANSPMTRALIVHDVLEWEERMDVPPESGHGLSRNHMETTLTQADLIITPSLATQAGIRRLFALPGDEAPIVCVPHAVSLPRSIRPDFDSGAGSQTVLHVGGRDGYKRFDLLLQAFARFRHRVPANLVTVGGRREFTDRESAQIRRLGLNGSVRSLGYVSDDKLASLYASARLLAHPSDGEGFGVQILEALAARVPIVAADLPVVQEVTRGSAYTFPVGNVEGLFHALELAWCDQDSDQRRARTAELAQVRTWKDSADVLCRAFEQASSNVKEAVG